MIQKDEVVKAMHQDKSVQNLSRKNFSFRGFWVFLTTAENHFEQQPPSLCHEGCIGKNPSCGPQYRIG